MAWNFLVRPQGAHLIAESLTHADLSGAGDDDAVIDNVDLHHGLFDGPLSTRCG
ncbi:hypothetical protein BN1263390046 [Stenotrophomonas maltophilia]|nr:hypothetical protein BN1263390046 [Stenotrophomonas maltophilia]